MTDRIAAWWRQAPVSRRLLHSHIHSVAVALPAAAYALNLCEDRYLFLVAFAAVLARAQTNLLPASRAVGEVAAVAARYPACYRLDDAFVSAHLHDTLPVAALHVPTVAATQQAAIVFTSGSTGQSQPQVKYWGDLVTGARLARQRFALADAATIVATVPPQHMYGLETSILVPLTDGIAVHGGRPFFPADICAALADVPEPRWLISTPAHLRVCCDAGLEWPALTGIISATAPLSVGLAARIEATLHAPVREIYGCTEAGSIASRRTVDGDLWLPYPGMVFSEVNGGQVTGPSLPAPVPLNDVIRVQADGRFLLLGRKADLVNVAGKRASLADLNQKLNAIAGVHDAVFIVPEDSDGAVNRLTALVVAPTLSEKQLLAALAEQLDPVFLPRPLYRVERLPRNDIGKLPRGELLALLAWLKST